MVRPNVRRLHVAGLRPVAIVHAFGASPEAQHAKGSDGARDGRRTHIIGRGVGSQERHEERPQRVVDAPDKGGSLGCVHGISSNPIEFDGFAVGSGSPSLAHPGRGGGKIRATMASSRRWPITSLLLDVEGMPHLVLQPAGAKPVRLRIVEVDAVYLLRPVLDAARRASRKVLDNVALVVLVVPESGGGTDRCLEAKRERAT